MRNLWKLLPLCVLVLAFVTVGYAVPAQSSQSQQGGASAQSAESSAMGELTKVDTTDQTITIKPEGGNEVMFRYDANTKVEGSQNGIQGLSTKTGTKVTVYYTEQSGNKLATRITVSE